MSVACNAFYRWSPADFRIVSELLLLLLLLLNQLLLFIKQEQTYRLPYVTYPESVYRARMIIPSCTGTITLTR